MKDDLSEIRIVYEKTAVSVRHNLGKASKIVKHKRKKRRSVQL
jgi:hypothetical protein